MPSHNWPSDNDLLALIGESGSVAAASRRLGVSPSTLKDHIRKQGLTEQAQALRSRRLQAVIADNDDEVSELDLLKARNDELERAARKSKKMKVGEERVLRAVEQAVEQVPPPKRAPRALPAKPSGEAHHRQLLVLSDFHGGEVVDPDGVNGLNAYDWAIQEDRVNELIDGVLSHQRRSPQLTGLDVLFVGDMCSGTNHQEIAETNEYPLAEQAVKMGYLQGSIIERLLPTNGDVRVGVVVGNHPRLQAKPAAKRIFDNGDWIAGVIMEEYLKKYPQVQCRVSRGGSLFWEIAGRLCYVWHGDGVRSSMPGVPFGGIMRRVNEIARQYDRKIDHFIYGHFHTATVVQGGRIIGNGSLKGVDEFCLKSFGGGDPPTQLLLTFDEKRSRLTDVKYLTPTAGLPLAA